uniref:Rap-GAP domain-containing protein n=1 Tax=Globisporangium ultimum (strain ATCC 200006 / CBS 805.95 / DAOM BR144) TaxID=431595 RepID=K3X8P3_GLOUD
MFLQWVAKCELVPLSAESYVLKKFSEKCQQGMCSIVVTFLSSDSVDLADVLPTGRHILWAMEVIGHSFALGMEDADVISGALRIYERWLGVSVPTPAANGAKPKDPRPACMQKVEQAFIMDMLGHMTLLFEERTDAASRSNEGMTKHVSLCIKVLDVFDSLVKRRGSTLSPQTWERMTRLLLGAADGLLHGSKSPLGNHLCGQFTRILFEIYLRSLPVCGPRGETWSLLQKFCRRWIHRILVIEQWNAVTLALTKILMKQIHSPDSSKEVEITWAETRVQSKFELENSLVAYAWHRLLRVIGHPSSIIDQDVYLAAIKGISRLADEFTRVEQLPTVKWEQVLGALNSAPSRDNSIFAAVPHGSAEQDALAKDIASSHQPRSPPDVNTILRLLGPWLFDACLTRKPRYDAGRSEAIRCLGKLLCQVSGGRSKRVNWAYGIRSLMALQNALLDDDERISASAVYNWSKVFGLYGNHTLRGAGVITGSFHKAVERIFRAAERREVTSSPKSKGLDSSRRATDPFYSQDEHSIGGIPIILLRRAAIEACSSLLTLHSHLPRHLIKEAEKEIVMSSMVGIPGLYSTLPKYTSSNVVALLMNAIKTEVDPTNQQMMMWLLTVAIQQEASYWAHGLASSRNSQVPVTILLICTIVSKSARYKPQVLFTAFECLRHLSLVCGELFTHATNSVVHVVNTCCDFLTTSAPVLRSSRAPFYLDSLMATAYYCIIDWIVAAPLLLSKPAVISKIIATVVDGNDRIQSFTSKTTAVAVREAAQRLVNMLMKHHVAQTESNMNSRSSVLNERMVLAELCGQEVPDVYSHCRFFSVNKSSILTVIEKPDDLTGASEAILIMRDSTGRYVWRFRPRYLDGPRPKSFEEFEAYLESNQDESDTEDTYSDDEDELGDSEFNQSSSSDPLLQAIRDTQSKTVMMSWRSSSSINSGSSEANVNSNKVLSGEGNTGMSSLIERRAMAAGRDDVRETQDAIFLDLLVHQTREDGEVPYDATVLNAPRCGKPKPPAVDKSLRSWETSRRMMTQMGFLSVRNWGSVFAMDESSGDLLRDLEALDKLPDRETFEIAVAYATSLSSKGGYDNVRLVSSADVNRGDAVLSPDYQLFLGALGERVDTENHSGYIGTHPAERTNGKLLYHSHYSCEMCFYVPTMSLKSETVGDNESESPQAALSLLERSNVLILWNECQQKYRPGSVLWDTVFNLPTPTSRVIIIIDPLGDDLYCVHIANDSSPLFNLREVISNDEDNCVDDGDVYCARVLGPLQDGMVVNGAWLAPLVRQTAINAASLSRAFHRYQYDIGAITTSPVGPEANRSNAIASVVEKHMRPRLPGQFYGELFTQI